MHSVSRKHLTMLLTGKSQYLVLSSPQLFFHAGDVIMISLLKRSIKSSKFCWILESSFITLSLDLITSMSFLTVWVFSKIFHGKFILIERYFCLVSVKAISCFVFAKASLTFQKVSTLVLSLQANNAYLRDQWLHSLVWRVSTLSHLLAFKTSYDSMFTCRKIPISLLLSLCQVEKKLSIQLETSQTYSFKAELILLDNNELD